MPLRLSRAEMCQINFRNDWAIVAAPAWDDSRQLSGAFSENAP